MCTVAGTARQALIQLQHVSSL